MGDIVYSLPTVQALGGGTFWVRKKDHYDALRLLLAIQPCVTSVVNRPPEKRGYVNLDAYRRVERVAYRTGNFRHLAECHLEALGKEADLTKPWLFGIEPNHVADIVVNRSTRYHDREDSDWDILACRDTVFIGYEEEYERFPVNSIPHCRCVDALDMAQIIKGSKLFIGNQSLGFAIAEAMKHPRVLEVYHNNANCMPKGDYGYVHLDEEVLNRHVCT